MRLTTYERWQRRQRRLQLLADVLIAAALVIAGALFAIGLYVTVDWLLTTFA